MNNNPCRDISCQDADVDEVRGFINRLCDCRRLMCMKSVLVVDTVLTYPPDTELYIIVIHQSTKLPIVSVITSSPKYAQQTDITSILESTVPHSSRAQTNVQCTLQCCIVL